MWNVDVKRMCNKHLLGEHVEMHMFKGCLDRKKSIKGYIDTGLVEVHNIKKRHDIIAKEMLRREMNHKSPLDVNFAEGKKIGRVDVKRNVLDLKNRCKNCRILMR